MGTAFLGPCEKLLNPRDNCNKDTFRSWEHSLPEGVNHTLSFNAFFPLLFFSFSFLELLEKTKTKEQWKEAKEERKRERHIDTDGEREKKKKCAELS